MLKVHKENNGQCIENNEKLYQVKRAGEGNCKSFIDRSEYCNLSWLFNISYCHYNQYEKLENNYKTSFWKSQHFFKKSECTPMLGSPSPCLFLFTFQWSPPPYLNEPTFCITPRGYKSKKIFFHHKILASFHIKSPLPTSSQL